MKLEEKGVGKRKQPVNERRVVEKGWPSNGQQSVLS